MKRYVPVREIERQTSHCPRYLAWQVLDEAGDYLRRDLPKAYAGKLARQAERVFGAHEFWQQKFKGARGREYLLASLRHWLAASLARENPRLFRQLPERFALGEPLPECPGAEG